MMVTRTAGLLLVFMAASAGIAAAQDPPPPVAQAPATVAEPARSTAVLPLSPEEMRKRRNAISVLESVLTTAVKQGADDVTRQIQSLTPGLNFMFTGATKAHGVALEGYGVFFHVEIPGVVPTVASLVEQYARGNRGEGRADRASTGAPANFDPDQAYTEAVKNNLIEALLEYGSPLRLGSNEMLTIAARDPGPSQPGGMYESITVVISLRGSDLADFYSRVINRDEMLRRVKVRGF